MEAAPGFIGTAGSTESAYLPIKLGKVCAACAATDITYLHELTPKGVAFSIH